ncbi:MAG: hypothetical protein MJ252_12370, partial [archaeon]|nr:hypothetical protein [archaeon]
MSTYGYNTSLTQGGTKHGMSGTTTNKFSKGGVGTGSRDDKVDPDLYYRVKDENEQLKKTTLTLNDKIKKLEANLSNVKEGIIRERVLADRKGIKVDATSEKNIKQSQLENEKLKLENDKLKLYIKGLQSDSKFVTKKEKSTKKGGKNPLQQQKEKNEQLALIAALRQSMKDLQEDKKNLIEQLTKGGGVYRGPSAAGTGQVRGQPHDGVDYQSQYEKTNLQLDTNNKILAMTKKSLQDYIEKYEKERNKNEELQAKLIILQEEANKAGEYKAVIDDLKTNEESLEKKIRDLCENSFIKERAERGDVYKKYLEAEKALTECHKNLRDNDEKIRELEKENRMLQKNLENTTTEKDRIKEDFIRLKVGKEENDRTNKDFQEQMKMLGEYGEIDDNFGKVLQLLKIRDDKNPWSGISFLDTLTEAQKKDPNFLTREIIKLKEDNGILGTELEKTKKELEMQLDINDDMRQKSELDQQKFQAEIKVLKQKIEELIKLCDINRLPKEYIVQDPLTNKALLKDRDTLLKELLPEDQKIPKLVHDEITEFSKDETEPGFSENENSLDLFLGQCQFEESLEKNIGIRPENLMSFVSVDFFIHETQTSNLVSGKVPSYNLQLSFRVNVDEHFINLLESDCIKIEIYFVKDNQQGLFAEGKIPLVELINLENDTSSRTRVVNSVCSLYGANEDIKGFKMGSLHYKMRMRNPILETLKYIHEKNKFISDINPVYKVMSNEAKQTMEEHKFTGGKIYNVSVLVSKAKKLIVKGTPRSIMPYFYYKFYDIHERYSNISKGENPDFQDVCTYTIVYNTAFHDYIQNDKLNIYLFDSSEPIEVDVSDNAQVQLIEEKEKEDVIGVCKIPLNGLLIDDLVQGSFPILNLHNQTVGELFVDIYWEEVKQPQGNSKVGDSHMTQQLSPNQSQMPSQMQSQLMSQKQFTQQKNMGQSNYDNQSIKSRSSKGSKGSNRQTMTAPIDNRNKLSQSGRPDNKPYTATTKYFPHHEEKKESEAEFFNSNYPINESGVSSSKLEKGSYYATGMEQPMDLNDFKRSTIKKQPSDAPYAYDPNNQTQTVNNYTIHKASEEDMSFRNSN